MTSRASLSLAFLALSLSACCHIFGDGDESDPDDFDDCAEKDEGDECSLCAPGDPDCIETMEIKVCDAYGECSSSEDPYAHHHD